jgi:hypothetical protein
VVDALHVGSAGSGRLDARPGDREALALLIEAPGERDVLRVEVVLVAGDVAGDAAADLAGGVGEAVPDGFALAVLVPCALVLVGGCGGAPEEAFRETGSFDEGVGDGAGDLAGGEQRSGEPRAARERGTGSGGEGTGCELATIIGFLSNARRSASTRSGDGRRRAAEGIIVPASGWSRLGASVQRRLGRYALVI